MTLRTVTFKLEEEKLQELDLLAKAVGKRRSDLIREAINELIMRYKYKIANQKMKETIAVLERLRVY